MQGRKTRSIDFNFNNTLNVTFGMILPPTIYFPKRCDSSKSINEALNSAIFLAAHAENIDANSVSTRPECVKSCLIRASISELCRTEDFVKQLDVSFSFYNSGDPIFHLIKILRNYQMHLSTMQLNDGQIEIMYSGSIMTYKSYIIDSLSIEEIRKVNITKNYTDSQIIELITWFDNQQKKLGITQFIFHATKHIDRCLKQILGN